MTFHCVDCAYKWMPKTDRRPNRCPYCSSKYVAEVKVAQELIDEL